MTRGLIATGLLAAVLAAAGCTAGETSAAADATAGQGERGSWRHSAVWDDGKAEYCVYEVDWFRYGQLWPGRAQVVVVKEPWAPELDVKADQARADGYEVLKLNHIRDVATGIYTYHQMASAFQRRDDGEMVKLATTSSEACGLSTATLVDGRLETESYFDGQGQRELDYPDGALPEDALAMLLRDYLGGSPPATIEVFPSLLSGRFPALEAASWKLSRHLAPAVEVPAGTYDGIEIRLARDGATASWTFAAEPPHTLIAHQGADGTRYRLAKCERLAYWQLARPGAEQWFPQSVRPLPAGGEASEERR